MRTKNMMKNTAHYIGGITAALCVTLAVPPLCLLLLVIRLVRDLLRQMQRLTQTLHDGTDRLIDRMLSL